MFHLWPTGVVRLRARNATTGCVLADQVGIAAGRLGRAVGLLVRDGLDFGEGLWIAPSRGVHTWGMRFPIDVLALDEGGRVVAAMPNLKPWRMRLPRPGTTGVLELAVGSLELSGTHVGDRVIFEIICHG